MLESSKALRPWRERIRALAQEHYTADPLQEALRVDIVFYFARPQNHMRTGRYKHELKASAPIFPATKRNDVDKLSRAILDGLTGVVFDDDGRVVDLRARKVYSTKREGAQVQVRHAVLL